MTSADRPSQSIGYDRLEASVFLGVLPALNTLIAASVLFNLDVPGVKAPFMAGLRLWATFGISLVLLRLARMSSTWASNRNAFWRQLVLHTAVILPIGLLFRPFIEVPQPLPSPRLSLAPRILLIMELAVYLVVVRTLKQQERWFATQSALREAELNVLRSQSNPHFLFNTLNLIASEVSRNPDNAKEIIFDLADLLRSSVRVAQQSSTTVAEEMERVRLYLRLQSQRFSDRLTFSMDIESSTEGLRIPALLLQPVVENTVKWAVAPNPTETHVHVSCTREDEQLVVVFSDTGPAFDDAHIQEGNGFRILRRTLELHYPGRWSARLHSTPEGGRLELRFPSQEHGPP
ncbi:MAG: histidine kinase [Myxococcota bacterium]